MDIIFVTFSGIAEESEWFTFVGPSEWFVLRNLPSLLVTVT